jgi:hypothetical protein
MYGFEQAVRKREIAHVFVLVMHVSVMTTVWLTDEHYLSRR